MCLTGPCGLVNTVTVMISTLRTLQKKVTLTKSVAERVQQQPTALLHSLDPYDMCP